MCDYFSELGFGRESASGSLDNFTAAVDTSLDAGLDVLVLDVVGEESSNEGISSTVGIDDEGRVKRRDLNKFDFRIASVSFLGGNNNGVLTLSDHDNSLSLFVGLLMLSKSLGNLLKISSATFDLIDISIDASFIFIAPNEIGKLKSFLDLVGVELHYESSGKVEAEWLVDLSAVLHSFKLGFGVAGNEESS